MSTLTVKALRSRFPDHDKWISDGAVRGSGALWARVGASGAALYFRYSHEGKKKALALGGYDEDGVKGLSLPQAREKAGSLSKLYQSGVTDLHGHLERERAADERARLAAEEAAKEAAADAQRGTLRQLLDAYVGYLERQGKQSARDVRSIFDKHVLEAVPELATRKAANLAVDDFVGMIGKVVEAKKGRTAGKLRSYLRAAFQLALESKTNPAAPTALRSFGISANPIASVDALSKFNLTRDRVLSAPEMGAFLRRVDALPEGAKKDALQLCVLLGGQRPMQLLRVKAADIDLSAATITLHDGKGARSQPRLHVLPLVKDAAAILKRRLQVAADDKKHLEKKPGDAPAPLFTTNDRTAMRHETVSVMVHEISKAMTAADPAEAREPFQLRDLRRTAETMLASLKVSSDIRAQIQSHGLGGVQTRHYDRHSYALEKKKALEQWSRHLEKLKAGETAKIVSIAGKRGKARS